MALTSLTEISDSQKQELVASLACLLCGEETTAEKLEAVAAASGNELSGAWGVAVCQGGGGVGGCGQVLCGSRGRGWRRRRRRRRRVEETPPKKKKKRKRKKRKKWTWAAAWTCLEETREAETTRQTVPLYNPTRLKNKQKKTKNEHNWCVCRNRGRETQGRGEVVVAYKSSQGGGGLEVDAFSQEGDCAESSRSLHWVSASYQKVAWVFVLHSLAGDEYFKADKLTLAKPKPFNCK